MKNNLHQGYLLTTLFFTSLGLNTTLQAEQLSKPQAGDFIPLQLGPVDRTTPLQNTSHEVVRFSWPAGNTIDSTLAGAAHIGKSRGYWWRVSASDLNKGINLDTSKPGVLVRISALDGGAAINPNELELDDNRGRRFNSTEALKHIVTAEKMVTAGTPFPRGTSSFRLAAARGMGRFVLRAPGLKSSEKQYHVEVQEDGSDIILSLQSNAARYSYGQSLTVDTRLVNGQGEVQLQSLTGSLRSPTGKSLPLNFQRKGRGSFSARLPSLQQFATGTGLLEAQVVAEGIVNGVMVRRNVKTVFAYSVPQARLTGKVTLSNSTAKKLNAVLDVEVANGGRYEVRGILYGMDKQGLQKPIMVSATAAWLEAGNADLKLEFDHTLLTSSNLTGPYEVRDLQLLDQSRMGMLHRQEKGFPF